VCDNPQIRGDFLEDAVWERVRAVLEEPGHVADEYRRRLSAPSTRTSETDDITLLDQQAASLRRGIGRLIAGYAEGLSTAPSSSLASPGCAAA
jgi:site-specific DNA recombinase